MMRLAILHDTKRFYSLLSSFVVPTPAAQIQKRAVQHMAMAMVMATRQRENKSKNPII